MKIKLIKDIPGYNAGKFLETPMDDEIIIDSVKHIYDFGQLIKQGYAEEVKQYWAIVDDDGKIYEASYDKNQIENLYEQYENQGIYHYNIVEVVIKRANLLEGFGIKK